MSTIYATRKALGSVIPLGLILAALTSAASLNVGAAEWRMAPLNPAFLAWVAKTPDERLPEILPGDSEAMGFHAGPMRIPQATENYQALSGMSHDPLPRRFDLRLSRGVTSVRNQGQCGSCWIFATYGSMESNLKYRQQQNWNFAEQDMNHAHGFDDPECWGGDNMMATAYLARWSGPFAEGQFPYPYATDESRQGSGTTMLTKKHVQEVTFLPERKGPLDNELIKRMIRQHGGVLAAYRHRKDWYNPETAAYYFFGEGDPTHAITVIGWNDDFPKSAFLEGKQPPGNGAFIIKNSWGSEWGKKGFFYLSYYDEKLSSFTAFHSIQAVGNYTKIYEYDPLGWTSSIGMPGNSEAWFSNLFIAATVAPTIKAVSFYTPVINSRYEISIYDRVEANLPVSGQKVATLSGVIGLPGYHTLPLETPAPVTPFKRFAVVVKLTTPGYFYPVPLETRLDGHTSAAKATMGESFISADGITWKDVMTEIDKKLSPNVALKAFGGR